MLSLSKHKVAMVKILKAVYAAPLLRENLGFKGGTAAMLFYDLPRMSVDLDFNLLKPEAKEKVWVKLNQILPEIAAVEEAKEKNYTLFFLLSYGAGQRKVKIEISKRSLPANFTPRNYLGISMFVMVAEDMAAGKLAALLTRKRFASRDLFDLWFFLKHDWKINEKFLKAQTGLTLPAALRKAAKITGKVPKNEILQGLGELLNPKQKSWAKENLKEDLLFQLALYREALKV